MDILTNPHRGVGLPALWDGPPVLPGTDVRDVSALLARCPAHAPTPLVLADALATGAGVGALALKDERARMGLGSFKALGAAHVIACDAQEGPLDGRTYVTASAGNHGLSVAAGARVFGARAVIYLARTVPEAFADRLRAQGAEVVRAGATYEQSMAAAAAAAAAQDDRTLLSDSSWHGYTEIPHRLMQGYLQMAAEITGAMDRPPSHVFLQAGVGGMAASVAAWLRRIWGDAPCIVVVEPQAAPALIEGIRAGRVVTAGDGVSAMGRLDCKQASLIALAGLARDADLFMTISEDQAADAVDRLAALDLPTTPSGAAGVAGLLASRDVPGLGPDARVLCILSEGGEET